MSELSDNTQIFSADILELIEQLKCPITKQIYKTPVLTSDGEIYEEDAALKTITEDTPSPITNKKLTYNIMTRIYPLQSLIDIYLDRYPILREQVYNNSIKYIIPKIHFFHQGAIKYAITSGKWDDMLEYTNYDATMMQDILQKFILNAPVNVLQHVINNCPNINIPIPNNDTSNWTSTTELIMNMVCNEKYHDKLTYFMDCPHIDITKKYDHISGQSFILHLVYYTGTNTNCTHHHLIKKIFDKGLEKEMLIPNNRHAIDDEPIIFIMRYHKKEMIQYVIDKLAVLLKNNNIIDRLIEKLKINCTITNDELSDIISQLLAFK